MVRRFHPASWVKVLRLLVDGTIPAVETATSEDALFDRLLVVPSDVERALGQPEPSIPNGLRVSCVGAAKLLGVSNVLVNGAFHAGLLPGWQIGRGDVHIEVADVAVFARQFVTPTEGSRLLGLSGVGFYGKMTALGFQPAGWARKFALWNRSDVEEALALQGQSASQPARRRWPRRHLTKTERTAPRRAESGLVKQARA